MYGVYNYSFLDIKSLIENSKNIWEKCDSKLPELNYEKFSLSKKKENENQFYYFINAFFDKLENHLKQGNKMIEEEMKVWVEENISKSFVFDSDESSMFEGNNFFDISKKFINRCTTYDDTLSFENIGQALRNVWIMNILQHAFNLEVECTDAIYGYSMLYPYTDNLMDNPDLSKNEKIEYSKRLSKRLKGEKILPFNEDEKKIFDMVENIERQFDRDLFPEVYESVLSIHNAQIDSLAQQSGDMVPYEKNMIEISFNKGGTSVLADGYLVKGNLSEEEEKFCFNYGVLLQLGDDLQDCFTDKNNFHSTIFSQLYGKHKYDNLTAKLINFILETFNENFNFDTPNNKTIKKAMERNCIMLVLGAALISKKCFSRESIKKIDVYFPVRSKFVLKIKKVLKQKMERLKKYETQAIDK